MKSFNLKPSLLFSVLFATLFFAGCQKDSDVLPDTELPPEEKDGTYSNGFFLVHEGWFGNGTGSVSFYNYETGKITDSVFQKENPEKDFEPTSSTLEYGSIFQGKLYLVSKLNGPVVVTDAKTMKEVGRIPALQGYDWRAFLGIDENTGLLSSNDGVHLVNLKTMAPYDKLYGISGQTGDMLKTEKYVFALSQREGAIVYNLPDLSVARRISGVSLGFAQTPNKKVWYTSNELLISLDATSLEADTVKLPFKSNNTWFTWYAAPLIASTSEDAVFIQNAPAYGGGKEVYKYVEGNANSLEKPFVTTPDRQSFYKRNIGYDGKTNQLVTTTVQDGYGANYAINNLYFYDGRTGELMKQIPFNGYYFTAMPVFHQGN